MLSNNMSILETSQKIWVRRELILYTTKQSIEIQQTQFGSIYYNQVEEKW